MDELLAGGPAGGKARPFEPRELIAVENLARTEALRVLGWTRVSPGEARRAAVFAGRGTAGAAALAVARHLTNYGVDCSVFVCGPEERLSPMVARERRTLEAMGVRTAEPSPAALTDALLAIGPRDALVDGAGQANAPGREREFASACRDHPAGGEETAAGFEVRLAPAADYRPPAPGADDALFSPDAGPRSREDIRLLDSTAIERYGIPGLVLMENAGWRAAREAYAMLGFEPAGSVLVLAGAGNNGGDGFVAARHLVAWGVDVEAILFASREKVMDDARTNLVLAEEAGVKVSGAGTFDRLSARVLSARRGGQARLPAGERRSLPACGGSTRQGGGAGFVEVVDQMLPVKLRDAALVVDALLGTGLTGKVRGPAGRAIEILGEHPRRILAVDTPSGLDANTGEVLGAATRAERTVTFAFPKLGFTRGEGPERTGEVVVADISMPRALWDRGAAARRLD